jgi:hypothetical protein
MASQIIPYIYPPPETVVLYFFLQRFRVLVAALLQLPASARTVTVTLISDDLNTAIYFRLLTALCSVLSTQW